MAIVRWDPFREMVELQDRVNRMVTDAMGRRGEEDIRRGAWAPPVDIFEADNGELVIKVDLPEVNRDDIEVTVENNTLTLSGERKQDPALKDDKTYRNERICGTFMRAFSLPPTVDPNRVAADYKNGVLTVRLPMREEAKPKQVQIQVS
jgi:HSP20 family protein